MWGKFAVSSSRSGHSKTYGQCVEAVERANKEPSQAEADVRPTVDKEEERSPVSITKTPAAQPITSTLELFMAPHQAYRGRAVDVLW